MSEFNNLSFVQDVDLNVFISLKKDRSFFGCDWYGEMEYDIFDSGHKHKTEHWFPFNAEEAEMAFVGEKKVVNGVLCGKVYSNVSADQVIP